MKINRLTNPESIDENFIVTEIGLGNEVIIQFNEITYTDKLLSEINSLLLSLNSNFQVRFYGHDKKTFDCKTLLKIGNVKNLSINCLKKIKNLGELSNLNNLEKLIFGVDDSNETEILSFENLASLTELNLDKNINTKFNLEYLKTFNKLKLLSISGNFKNVVSIGEIENLETLYLGSISNKTSLDFVNQLKKLKELHISFGSRENIDEVIVENLEKLSLLWIRNLKSINDLSRFHKLKSLSLENQGQIEAIEFDKEMKFLTLLSINNCKKISTLKGLNNLVSLKIMGILRSPKLSFEDIINRDLPKTLEHINFYTAKQKIDKEIKEKIRNLGYKTS